MISDDAIVAKVRNFSANKATSEISSRKGLKRNQWMSQLMAVSVGYKPGFELDWLDVKSENIDHCFPIMSSWRQILIH
jgi:hypothetical protein